MMLSTTDIPYANWHRVFFYLFCILAIQWLPSCNYSYQKTDPEEFYKTINGRAQGTTYRIGYYDLKERNLQLKVDSLLNSIDASISTYDPSSLISQFNASDSGSTLDRIFWDVLKESQFSYSVSEGAFDPSLKPLIDYWGFGDEKFKHPESIDTGEVKRLLEYCVFDSLKLVLDAQEISISEIGKHDFSEGAFLVKPAPEFKLEFNAIGQGLSVDMIGQLLESLGIDRYFVELGGEVLAGKQRPDGRHWRFGIDRPLDINEQRALQAIISLRERGLATSGNYRKYYELNGVKYPHTIDPSTGFPVKHSLLSATVVSDGAGYADAMATAFMVLGKDSTVNFLKERNYLGIQVYLIADDRGSYDSYMTPSLEHMIELIDEDSTSDSAR